MGTFIDLLPVPGDILELVKARILANRKRNKKPEAKPAPKTARRRYYSELAPDRRPEPAGIPSRPGETGLGWVLLPDLGSFFNAQQRWRHDLTNEPLISDADQFSFKVGCGDGSKWITATLTLSGIAAWRNTRETFFTPYTDDISGSPLGASYTYASNPTGKFIDASTRISYVDDSRITQFALPCGNGCMILIVHVRAAGSAGGSMARATGAIYNEFFNVYVVTAELMEQVDLKRLNVTATDVAAFVVSQTDCREITVPATLRSALNTLLPDANWNGAPSWIIGGLTPDYLSLNTASNEYWYESSGLYYRMFEDILIRPEFKSYGASADAMESGPPFYQVDVDSYSPSMLAALTKYTDYLPDLPFVDGIDFDFNYAEAGERLRELGVPAPRDIAALDVRTPAYQAFATALYEGQPGYDGPRRNGMRYTYLDPDRLLPSLRVVRANSQPGTWFASLPQSRTWSQVRTLPLADTRPSVEATPEDSYTLFWHYDWGKSNYCRQQLLALGFTAEDLTP